MVERKKLMWKNYGNLLDILFPPQCLFCREAVGQLICQKCLGKIQISEESTVTLNSNGTKITAPFEYDGIVRDCIKMSKYGAKQFAALTILSKACIAYSKELNLSFDGFIAAPIPLNPRKYRLRGFNQAEILARILASDYKIPLALNLIKRSKQTTGQYQLNKEERKENLKGAFTCSERLVKNKKILLVDDICTTGSTLTEAGNVLLKAGAIEVKAFCLSKVS